MMKHKLFHLLAVLLLLASVVHSATADENIAAPVSELTVVINAIDVEQAGQLILSLYQGKEAWLEPGAEHSRRILPIPASGTLTTTFSSLLVGQEFAVQVIHDRNENGVLDFQWFPPKPKEGVGVSNNSFRMGPPDYDVAKFILKGDTKTLTINMHY
jgi:uncharacterized protein (DUF2141 family)